MKARINVVVPYEEWDKKTAAQRLGMDVRSFERVYGDLGFTPVDRNGVELRMKHYRSTDIAKRSHERAEES